MTTTSTSAVLRPLTEANRNNIVNDLLDSIMRNPKQTPRERARATAQIARRRRVGVMQVAGVRAALTSGAYGKLSTLKSRRRREQSAVILSS